MQVGEILGHATEQAAQPERAQVVPPLQVRSELVSFAHGCLGVAFDGRGEGVVA